LNRPKRIIVRICLRERVLDDDRPRELPDNAQRPENVAIATAGRGARSDGQASHRTRVHGNETAAHPAAVFSLAVAYPVANHSETG
jgi:hypothetical protein